MSHVKKLVIGAALLGLLALAALGRTGVPVAHAECDNNPPPPGVTACATPTPTPPPN
jgi:hypothetical protein